MKYHLCFENNTFLLLNDTFVEIVKEILNECDLYNQLNPQSYKLAFETQYEFLNSVLKLNHTQ